MGGRVAAWGADAPRLRPGRPTSWASGTDSESCVPTGEPKRGTERIKNSFGSSNSFRPNGLLLRPGQVRPGRASPICPPVNCRSRDRQGDIERMLTCPGPTDVIGIDERPGHEWPTLCWSTSRESGNSRACRRPSPRIAANMNALWKEAEQYRSNRKHGDEKSIFDIKGDDATFELEKRRKPASLTSWRHQPTHCRKCRARNRLDGTRPTTTEGSVILAVKVKVSGTTIEGTLNAIKVLKLLRFTPDTTASFPSPEGPRSAGVAVVGVKKRLKVGCRRHVLRSKPDVQLRVCPGTSLSPRQGAIGRSRGASAPRDRSAEPHHGTTMPVPPGRDPAAAGSWPGA